jgi:hypothetical protein
VLGLGWGWRPPLPPPRPAAIAVVIAAAAAAAGGRPPLGPTLGWHRGHHRSAGGPVHAINRSIDHQVSWRLGVGGPDCLETRTRGRPAAKAASRHTPSHISSILNHPFLRSVRLLERSTHAPTPDDAARVDGPSPPAAGAHQHTPSPRQRPPPCHLAPLGPAVS